jgi:hypothetical protein
MGIEPNAEIDRGEKLRAYHLAIAVSATARRTYNSTVAVLFLAN